ncbi:lipase family protein [Herbiconiux daphne]|uniref:Lipase family protein n=1 Tax=Herbiconiux daphne TaxID=2970914 RepID=A0ABT2H8V7_9MICO|nr:lipase family protein [Herbiconiux daphne]MCS5736346.1 lipase family protein [Herbiconiux daphne]
MSTPSDGAPDAPDDAGRPASSQPEAPRPQVPQPVGPRPPHRARRIVARTVTVVALVAAVVIGLIIASGYWNAETRLAEGAVEEATEAPFYALPSPVPSGEPGTILRSEKIASAPEGALAWRILYHSTDVLGDDIVVSGVVVAPDSPAPAGGRPIVSWGHPTTGATERCAPSVGIDPFDLIEGLDDLLRAGYVVAATDYSGLGVDGPDSYLIGTTEGNNVLDAARAARALEGTGASDRLVLWGHSQGGQAVLFAGQSAAQYAPDLDLRGVAVAAPATDLAALLKADIGDVSGVTIGSYAFTAFASVYGPSTPGATLDSILTPEAAAQVDRMSQLCLLGQNSELHTIGDPLIGHFLAADPGTTEPWATLLAENSPGGTRLPVPLFVAQGDIDELVRPEITAAFVASQRQLGTVVTAETVENTGHGLVATRALPRLLDWLGTIDVSG